MANNKRKPKKSVEPEPRVPKKETQNHPKKSKPSPSPRKKSRSPSPSKPEAPPKRPRSGYLIFCSQHRKNVTEENSHLKPKEITSLMGKLWKELPEDKKEDYNKLAREEKEAFQRYMETHKDDQHSPIPQAAQKRKAQEENPKPNKKKATRGKK